MGGAGTQGPRRGSPEESRREGGEDARSQAQESLSGDSPFLDALGGGTFLFSAASQILADC